MQKYLKNAGGKRFLPCSVKILAAPWSPGRLPILDEFPLLICEDVLAAPFRPRFAGAGVGCNRELVWRQRASQNWLKGQATELLCPGLQETYLMWLSARFVPEAQGLALRSNTQNIHVHSLAQTMLKSLPFCEDWNDCLKYRISQWYISLPLSPSIPLPPPFLRRGR